MPLMLKGHERAINFLTYNRDGDLFVSCAREPRVTLWSATTGERLGTFEGHDEVAVVNHADFSRE
jgi:translation initiation factor 3 subunit I